MTHTPGPWRMGEKQYSDDYGYTGHSIYDAREDLWIASVNGAHVRVPVGQIEANARLIAAAPDLLEALEATTEGGHYRQCLAGQRGYGTCSAVCDKVRAAIAKAMGAL